MKGIYVTTAVLLTFIAFSIFYDFYQLPKGKPLTPPNYHYPLGTYVNGDNMVNVNANAIVNTLIFGSIVGLGEVGIATVYGVIAGSYGYVVRSIMVRIADSINSIPRIPLLLSIALFYGVPTGNSLKANFFLTALIVLLTGWSVYARQIAEIVYQSSVGIVTRRIIKVVELKISFIRVKKLVINLFIPAMIDGISTYTAMGVIGGVGDPNYPTLTTLLNTASHLIPDWWLFLIPAVFRGALLVLLLILADQLRRI